MSKSRAEVNQLLADVSYRTRRTAEYVIAHAERQTQRGKNPSIEFIGHKNPRIALEAAAAVIKKCEELATQDPTLRVIDSEYALSGGRYQSPIEAGHVWGRD
jgi:hypothetical protein